MAVRTRFVAPVWVVAAILVAAALAPASSEHAAVSADYPRPVAPSIVGAVGGAVTSVGGVASAHAREDVAYAGVGARPAPIDLSDPDRPVAAGSGWLLGARRIA